MVNDNVLIHNLGLISKFDIQQKDFSFQESSNFVSSCGDKLSVFFDLRSGTIYSIVVAHSGCILSKAITNALLLAIEHKTVDFALDLIDQFINFFIYKHSQTNQNNFCTDKLTSDLILFEKFASYPSRKDCILMPVKTIQNILQQNKHEHNT